MLKNNSRLIENINRITDLFITTIAFVVSYIAKRFMMPDQIAGLSTAPNYYLILALILMIWYIAFDWQNAYAPFRHRSFPEIILNLLKSVITGLMLLTLTLYIMKLESVSRIMIGTFIVLDFILLSLWKFFVYKSLHRLRKDGRNIRNILVVGSRKRARNLIAVIENQIGTGYRIDGCLEIDSRYIGNVVSKTASVIGLISEIEEYLRLNVVDEIIFAMPLKDIPDCDRYITIAEDMGVKCRIIPDWQLHYLMYNPDVATIRFEHFLGVPTISLQSTPFNPGGLYVKTLIDYIATGIGVVMLAPLLIAIAVSIKLFSKGPVFYTQPRLGLNGRIFHVIKFRTMVVNADALLAELQDQNEADGPAFKISKDPRIIPYIGTFLRKTSLDELPQLINVLRGDMSLVGPRPPLPNEVNQYEIWQRRRLSMKPGLTCIWQIAPGRNDISFDQWMRMDLEYIDNWSLWLDFKLIFGTVRAVLFGSGR